MKSNRSIQIYDTSLREGNQSVGIGFSLSDKLHLVSSLDSLGVHYIEGGWPNQSNVLDCTFYKEVQKLNCKAKIVAFGCTKRIETSCGNDPFLQSLLLAETETITLFGKAWDFHVREVLQYSLDDNLAVIFDSITYLKKYCNEIIFDAEHFFDGYQKNRDYAIKVLQTAHDAGADTLVLCDTNGSTLPMEFQKICRSVAKNQSFSLGVHTHNDSGCADANAIIAVNLGAKQVQGTLNGIGERCGNANLCTLLPNLQLKQGYDCVTPQQLKKLTSASFYFCEIANMNPDKRKPYVGTAAFSHKAGTHIDAIKKNQHSFEHINPDQVGNKRQFVLSNQAGASTILKKLAHLKPTLNKNDPIIKKLLHKMKELESQGYHFEAAEASFELIAQRYLHNFHVPFSIKSFKVATEHRHKDTLYSEAVIKIEYQGRFEHTAADGIGPVHAMDRALKKALSKFFPNIKSVCLEDYKVRVLDGSNGTAAKVRVLIESTDGKNHWGTIGVSTNIIEASMTALMDSVNYKLCRDLLDKKNGAKGSNPDEHVLVNELNF